jgi:hypothetical protein
MLHRSSLTISLLLLSCCVAAGKDKKKVLLTADVLRAHTVLVMVDPQAGVDAQHPNANMPNRRNNSLLIRNPFRGLCSAIYC